jgi:tetratricopeptide (TPR) repeat protein
MVTRCPSCGTRNRLKLFRGDARCGRCRTDLALPRPIGFLQRHRRAAIVVALLAVAVPAVALYEGRAERWNEEGVRLAEAGQYEEAIHLFAGAIKADPRLAKAHYNMGVAYMSLGHRGQAVAHLQVALTLDPGDVDASALLSPYARLARARSQRYRP